jgi:hypothetical protein
VLEVLIADPGSSGRLLATNGRSQLFILLMRLALSFHFKHTLAQVRVQVVSRELGAEITELAMTVIYRKHSHMWIMWQRRLDTKAVLVWFCQFLRVVPTL